MSEMSIHLEYLVTNDWDITIKIPNEDEKSGYYIIIMKHHLHGNLIIARRGLDEVIYRAYRVAVTIEEN